MNLGLSKKADSLSAPRIAGLVAGALGIAAMTYVAAGGATSASATPRAPRYSGLATVAFSGKVVGNVACSEEGQDPKTGPGVTVFLKGHSFVARTDDAGNFEIDYVPVGSYDLAVVTSGRKIREEVPISVSHASIVDVGNIVVTGSCTCGGEEEEGGGGGGGCPGEGA